MAEATETTPAPAPSSPPAASPGAPAPSPAPSHLDTLAGDYLPAASTSPRAERPTPEPPAPEPGEPKPEPDQAAAKPPETSFKYRGKDYTLAELGALLPSILTTAEQFPHLQAKYQEILERLTQPAPPPQPVGPSVTPQQFQANLRTHYGERAQQVVANGWVEPDFAELYPNVTTQALYLTEGLQDTIGRLVQLERQVNGMGTETLSGKVRGALDSALDTIAGQGQLYQGLKDQGKRREFLEWLRDTINPVADWSNVDAAKEILGRQWLAFNSAAILEATAQTAERESRERDDAKRRAQGASGGPRPAAPPPAAPSVFESLLEDVLPRR